MATLTKSQLIAQLEAAHVSYQLLEDHLHDANERIKLLIIERDMFANTARNDKAQVRNNKLVHLFDPEIKGDFQRALAQCRTQGGLAKRIPSI